MVRLTKLFWMLILLLIVLVVAAQCGARPTEAPVAAERATEETGAVAAEEHAAEEDHAHAQEAPAGDTDAALDLEPVSLGEGEKLRVVATNSIIADLVSNVGGDLIDLTPLMPIGVDPHSFQPTPGDVANVANAHVFLANGLGLEEFLAELIENAGDRVVVVSLSEGVEVRELGEGERHTHADEAGEDEHAGQEEHEVADEHADHEAEAEHEEHGEEAEHEDHAAGELEPDHEHEGVDPHTWTTPANAIIFVHNIEQALSALDPAHAGAYAANAEAYEAQLAELDRWVQAQIETIPAENRKLVTDHTVFGYYADRYGLEQIGAVIPSLSTAAEPSARELADLEDAIKAQGVKAIFVGNTVNPGLEQRVAEDTGTRLVTLYTESLGPAGSGVETYLDYVRYNTTAIVEALQ